KIIISRFRRHRIKIIFRSDNIIVVDKDYDMKINSNNDTEITVQTLLKQQYPSLANDKLFHEFYFPHRLDYATSGVMCIPTNKEACRVISNTFHTRRSKKYYIAIVRGLLSKEIIDVDMAIGEDIREQTIQKMCTANSQYCVKSRAARTIFIILDKGLFDNYPATKVLIRPVTGRRHQIRAHCSYLGHTIVGDYTYSNRKDINPSRMFLHSLRLVLPNPMENIDVNTRDPFIDFKEWTTVEKINSINKITYDKFEPFLY
ncbi:RNA pseudouridylate synthase domain-containing protein 1-like, partial [Anoplophora glabripennis]|uniref:RNA pseudouridylate synthase domain-containing protein 1-like n=1 Tax=Anoplophora glabripennis TaxID=217634 RepID=UPI0008743542